MRSTSGGNTGASREQPSNNPLRYVDPSGFDGAEAGGDGYTGTMYETADAWSDAGELTDPLTVAPVGMEAQAPNVDPEMQEFSPEAGLQDPGGGPSLANVNPYAPTAVPPALARDTSRYLAQEEDDDAKEGEADVPGGPGPVLKPLPPPETVPPKEVPAPVPEPQIAEPTGESGPTVMIGGKPFQLCHEPTPEETLDSARRALEAGAPRVNLASPARTNHILNGDATGGGHMWPGAPGKTPFPEGWSEEDIMHAISDVATDPALSWQRQTGPVGSWFTNAGDPARFFVIGEFGGIQLKVVLEPYGEGIITGHPLSGIVP